MSGIRFTLLLLLIVITGGNYSHAQFHGKNNTANNIIDPGETIHNPSSSKATETDTIYSSLIKENFIVNNFDGNYGADQIYAAAAIDGKGNYAITWLDYRNENSDIYVQFFNSNDEKIGSNIKVNQQTALLYDPPSIAANNNGNFVIAWLKENNTIEVQGFNVNSVNIDNNFETKIPAFSRPSVTVSDNGSFIICWSGDNIMAELFDRKGTPIKTDIILNELGTFHSGFVPGENVAVDDKGNFYIAWITYETNNVSKVYLQVLDSLGEKVNNNILVTNLNDGSNKNSLQIAATNKGNVILAWQYSNSVNGNYTSGEKIRIYSPKGYFVTDDISLDNVPDKIVSGGDSTFFISYSSVDNQGNQKRYIQKININGEVIDDKEINFNTNKNFVINDITLTDVVNNHFIVVPELKERDDANIYVQKFNTGLEATGTFTRVHDDSGSAYQLRPIVKFNKKGESIVLWEDKRNGRFDLYAQLYDKDFNPVGSNVMINETDAELVTLIDKKVQCLSDGSFVIAYSYYEDNNYNNKVFLRLINDNYLGNNVSVKTEDLYENLNLALNINSNDEILVCFYSSMNAFLRKYDKGLIPLTSRIKFIQYQYIHSKMVNFYDFAVSVDTDFNILAAGRLTNSNNYQIIGKFFNEEGEETSNFTITNKNNINYTDIKCMNDKEDYAVFFHDYNKVYVMRRYYLDREYFLKNEFDIQSYFYDNIINLIEFKNKKLLLTFNSFPNVMAVFINDNKRDIKLCKVHTYSYPHPSDLYSQNFGGYCTDYFNNRLFITYEKNNPATGYDIQANVQVIDSINFNDDNFRILPIKDALLDNYPNPFNSNTKITYKLAAYHKVKLTIYDVLGREVQVLVNRYQERGTYNVEFNGSSLASGIYIYRFEAFDKIVKKMILLK